MIAFLELAKFSGLLSFVVGLPTTVGTYYQVWRTRQETKEIRQGLVYSQNCLEFVLEDGTFVNVVPLETLHSPSAARRRGAAAGRRQCSGNGGAGIWCVPGDEDRAAVCGDWNDPEAEADSWAGAPGEGGGACGTGELKGAYAPEAS